MILKPILTPLQSEQVDSLIATFKYPEKWQALKLPHAPRPSTCALFTGVSGTGKTTLARHLVSEITGITDEQELDATLPQASMAEIGGHRPGDTERNMIDVFKNARKGALARDLPFILFFDECDGVVYDRKLIGSDSLFMLGVIGQFLQQIDLALRHKKGCLLILATNLPKILDHALRRRITDHIVFTRDNIPQRAIWKSKCPPSSNLRKVMEQSLPHLEELRLTPAEIQQSLITLGRLWMIKPQSANSTRLIEIARTYHTNE